MAGSRPKVKGPARPTTYRVVSRKEVYLPVQSYLIEHEGDYAGHALTLGTRFMFHTPREELSDLDETCFNSIEALCAAVATALDQE